MSLPVLADSLQTYLTEISRYPVLSPEEEFEVAERYYKFRKMDDAHRLVVANLRYVVKIALEFRNYGVRLSDLVQEGNIGLMVAVKKFNPYKGYRLITYATWWIKSFMQEFILKNRGLVRRGSKALKKKLFYRNSAEPSAAKSNNEDLGDIASYDLSLDAPVSDGSTTHLGMLKDSGPGPMEAVEAIENSAIVKNEVTSALAVLNDKERMIVEKRLMNDSPESLQAIGERLGLTRERVRQIESSALKKLRERLAGAKTEFLSDPA